MDHQADRRTLQGCISGEEKAREAFVIRFSNLVYQTIQGTFKTKNLPFNRLDLEDLHNTVFVRLFEKGCRKLRQYEGRNGCSVSTWIRLITIRTVLDFCRKAKRDALTRGEKTEMLDSIIGMQDDPPGQCAFMEKKERSCLIQKELQTLPPRDRLLLKLHYEGGLSLRDVAAIMKISKANAYSIKHRAIKRLSIKMTE